MNKYKLTDETKEFLGRTLHHIVCVTASGDAWLSGDVEVSGDARVEKTADYIVLKNNWSSGRYFTYTLSNKKWRVGCFYGTSEELIKKAYADSELSGKCYEAAVRYVEALEKIQAEVK